MSEKGRYIDIVVKLMQLTKKGKVKWHLREDVTARALNLRSTVYSASYKGSEFRIQNAMTYAASDPNRNVGTSLSAALSSQHYRLEVTDPNGDTTTFPQLEVVDDLVSMIKSRKSADLDEIERLLSED